jgi:hypothetical protein
MQKAILTFARKLLLWLSYTQILPKGGQNTGCQVKYEGN